MKCCKTARSSLWSSITTRSMDNLEIDKYPRKITFDNDQCSCNGGILSDFMKQLALDCQTQISIIVLRCWVELLDQLAGVESLLNKKFYVMIDEFALIIYFNPFCFRVLFSRESVVIESFFQEFHHCNSSHSFLLVDC